MLFFIYVGLIIYQTNNLEIVSFEDIRTIDVSSNGGLGKDTVIQIEAEVERFEALEMVETEVVEETLYLIIHKWPAFKQVDKIELSLENVDSLKQINQISVIYGDPYSGEGTSKGFFLSDLIDHPEQKIIWEKERSE